MQTTWKKFRRDAKGSTAIEFGLIAAPVFATFLMIIEMGAGFWAGASLDLAAVRAAEAIRSGLAQGLDKDTFKARYVCPSVGIMDCKSVNVQVDPVFHYGHAPTPSLDLSSFGLGAPRQLVSVQLSYPFPVIANYLTSPVTMFEGRRVIRLTGAVGTVNSGS